MLGNLRGCIFANYLRDPYQSAARARLQSLRAKSLILSEAGLRNCCFLLKLRSECQHLSGESRPEDRRCIGQDISVDNQRSLSNPHESVTVPAWKNLYEGLSIVHQPFVVFFG